MNPIDTQPDALRLADMLESDLMRIRPHSTGKAAAAELRRLHAELDRLRQAQGGAKCGKECERICQQPDGYGGCHKSRFTSGQAQGGEAVAWTDKVATAVLDTPEPDKWVDCGEARPLPMFHMATLMQYGERCAEAALSTFTLDVKTRDYFVPTKVTDEMVSRFLSWKLPKDFYPDSFISFDREKHDAWGGYPNSWPTGTNLLHAEQAKEMLQHVLGNTSPPLQADAKVPQGWKLVRVGLDIDDAMGEAGHAEIVKAGGYTVQCLNAVWKAMLSASPAAPIPEVGIRSTEIKLTNDQLKLLTVSNPVSIPGAAPTQVETQEVRQREIQKLQAWRDEIASGNAYRVGAEIEAILRAAARSTPPMEQK